MKTQLSINKKEFTIHKLYTNKPDFFKNNLANIINWHILEMHIFCPNVKWMSHTTKLVLTFIFFWWKQCSSCHLPMVSADKVIHFYLLPYNCSCMTSAKFTTAATTRVSPMMLYLPCRESQIRPPNIYHKFQWKLVDDSIKHDFKHAENAREVCILFVFQMLLRVLLFLLLYTITNWNLKTKYFLRTSLITYKRQSPILWSSW